MSSNSKKVYNWGIIGCGKISTDFTNCLVQYNRARIVACGARSLEKSRNFAKNFGVPYYNAYSSYDAVSNDPNVDIVYIGTIHPSHYKSVIHALNSGKHVLCEKPIGMNAMETEAMIKAARKNNRFLMEAMWTRFFPAIRKTRELLQKGVIGDVVNYYGDFGVNMPSAEELPRIWEKQLGGGGILDLGCYPTNPVTWIFGPRMPTKICAAGIVDKKYKIDTVAAATLIYEDTKQFAQLSSNCLSNTFEEFLIVGKKGRIRCESPAHAPLKITVYETEEGGRDVISVKSFQFEVPKGPQSIFPGSNGLIYQVYETTKCLDEGRIESPEYQHCEMLVTMKIMDEMRRQIGVTYEQDTNMRSKL